jgi:hypothetical protein
MKAPISVDPVNATTRQTARRHRPRSNHAGQLITGGTFFELDDLEAAVEAISSVSSLPIVGLRRRALIPWRRS